MEQRCIDVIEASYETLLSDVEHRAEKDEQSEKSFYF